MVVLDVTAGNRHIWGGWIPEIPAPGPVVFSDIETGLKKSPELFADLRALPIRSGVFDAVVSDLPYWNYGTSRLHGDPQEKEGSFWGKFYNLRYLRSLIVGLMKESRRVLRPGGLLYVKWCDVVYPWSRFSGAFSWDFDLVEKEERVSRSGRNTKPCYWFTYSLKE